MKTKMKKIMWFLILILGMASPTIMVLLALKTLEIKRPEENILEDLVKLHRALPLVTSADTMDGNTANTAYESQMDMFLAKSKIMERLSAVDPGDVRILGIEKAKLWDSKFLDPYIRVEEYGDLNNTSIHINEQEIVSPDLMIVEKYKSPVDGNEHFLSAVVSWFNLDPEKKNLDYWTSENDVNSLKYARGNPDGSISLFICLSADMGTIMEIRTTDTSEELLSVSTTYRSANAAKIREIIGEISNLCDLRESLQTGRWVWRKNGGIPNFELKRLKSFIDGGLIQWREITEWNGFPLIDGDVVTWNGVLLSLQLILEREHSESLLKILEPLSKSDGFSLTSTIDDDARIVKILVMDNFVLNFSSLWGSWD